jgi:magnesium-transporting ATPase (P-type)
MYLLFLPLSFLIPSSSGLATVAMPIMAPLASFASVPPQYVVTAYQSANGLLNLITPTSAVVMGGLAIARVGYGTWLKFVWPILLLLAILTIIVLPYRCCCDRAASAMPQREEEHMTTLARQPGGATPSTASTAGSGDGTVARAHDRRALQRRASQAGLSAAEVKRQATAEQVADAPGPRLAFLRQYKGPDADRAARAGILSLFIPSQFVTGILLIRLTLPTTGMGLSQEGKASASVEALQKMMVVQAKVRRDGALASVAMEDIVPGDIVNIEAGDLVPADGRVLTSATLEIDESALTGESLPVPKQIAPVASDSALGDRIDLAFMNTQVTRGSGTMVVIGTGMSTEVGHSAACSSSRPIGDPLTQRTS